MLPCRKMVSVFATALIAVSCVLAGPAAAPGRGDPYAAMDPSLREVLQRFDAAQARVTSISARFTERKEIGLFKNALLQKGQFFHTKPDKFLWEYSSPDSKVLLMNGTSLVAYYPEQKEAEEIQTRLSRRLVRYFGLGQIFADLQEYYNLALGTEPGVAGTRLIVMTPRVKHLEKRLQDVRVWLDEQLMQVKQLEYRETDGDRTQFVFEDIRVNPEISATRYEIALPEDVHVSTTFAGFFAEKGR